MEALLKAGKHTVTAISRKGSASTFAEGVQVKPVDYSDTSTIVEALRGQDVFIITMAVTAPQDQSEKLIRAAAEAGVPWIVPNEFGGDGTNDKVNQDVLLGIAKKKDRDLIESLGVSSWVSICCGFWYEFSLGGGTYRYGFDIPKREVMFFDDGEQRMNSTTFPQIGRGLASLLSLKVLPENESDKSPTLSQYRNNYCYISSFTVNQKEMFKSLQHATGTTEKDWKISSRPSKEAFEEGHAEMKQGNMEGFGKQLYTRMFFPGDNALLFEKTHGLDNEKLALPKEDLNEFAKRAVEIAESDYHQRMYSRT